MKYSFTNYDEKKVIVNTRILNFIDILSMIVKFLPLESSDSLRATCWELNFVIFKLNVEVLKLQLRPFARKNISELIERLNELNSLYLSDLLSINPSQSKVLVATMLKEMKTGRSLESLIGEQLLIGDWGSSALEKYYLPEDNIIKKQKQFHFGAEAPPHKWIGLWDKAFIFFLTLTVIACILQSNYKEFSYITLGLTVINLLTAVSRNQIEAMGNANTKKEYANSSLYKTHISKGISNHPLGKSLRKNMYSLMTMQKKLSKISKKDLNDIFSDPQDKQYYFFRR